MKRPTDNQPENKPLDKRLPVMMPAFRYVEIHWVDAIGVEGSWVTDDELPTPAAHVTRGWLIKDTPDYVVVAATFGFDDKDEMGYGEVLCIPRGMISYLDDFPERA